MTERRWNESYGSGVDNFSFGRDPFSFIKAMTHEW